MKEAIFDSSHSLVQIKLLNVYPAQLTCADTVTYANLYVAKTVDGMVIYIFEPCCKVSYLAFDTTERYPPLIDKSRILKQKKKNTIVFVPKDFILSKDAKYVVTKVGYFKDI